MLSDCAAVALPRRVTVGGPSVNVPSFVARSVQTVVSPRWLEIVPFTMLICDDVDGDIPTMANPFDAPS